MRHGTWIAPSRLWLCASRHRSIVPGTRLWSQLCLSPASRDNATFCGATAHMLFATHERLCGCKPTRLSVPETHAPRTHHKRPRAHTTARRCVGSMLPVPSRHNEADTESPQNTLDMHCNGTMRIPALEQTGAMIAHRNDLDPSTYYLDRIKHWTTLYLDGPVNEWHYLSHR